MFKAKFFLVVIFFFAILGGFAAFKTSRILHVFYKTGPNGACTVSTLTLYTTDPALAIGPPITITLFNPSSHTGNCSTIILYPAL
ncbi:hypothetical protein SAMN05428988_3190 [Chitinophaga sp. YR573]|nr:hypothetical protein SAMN05428988_3190 [Chitinophaga sp. YR573]